MRPHTCAIALFTAACALACDASTHSAATPHTGPDLSLTEVFRVGSVEDPDAGFSSIGSVDVAEDGTIYLFENRDKEIRVLSAVGEPVARFGGEGSGPGEFSGLTRTGVVGDTVWALELAGARHFRLILFDRSGSHLSTRMIAVEPQVGLGENRSWGFGPSALLPGGRLEGGMRVVFREGLAEGPTPRIGDTVPVPRVVLDLDGQVVDTLGYDPYVLQPPDPPVPTVSVEGTSVQLPTPPSAEPHEIKVGGGRVIFRGPKPTGPEDARITFTHVTFDGDTMIGRHLSYPPIPYTDAFLDTLAARGARSASNRLVMQGGVLVGVAPFDQTEAATRAIRDALDFGPYAPPVEDVRHMDDGSFWIQLHDDGGLTTNWIILAADGTFRRRLSLPRRSAVRWASADEFITVEPDEFDVPWLVKYRLAEGS